MICTIHVTSEREKIQLLEESKRLYDINDQQDSFLLNLWKNPDTISHGDKTDIIFDENWAKVFVHLDQSAYREKTRKRILRKSILDPETGCRNWQGAKNDKGYGLVKV